jgi:hypothetical protein
VQPAGGVDDDHVRAARRRRVERVEDDGRRIGARCMGDDGHVDPPAHTWSCSMAAARKVSAAASSTFAPRVEKRCASLAMVVVLPVPLTPTTSTTAGTPGAGMRGQGVGSRGANSASSSAMTAASAFSTPSDAGACARSATTRSASSAPTSAAISASSTSSHVVVVDGPAQQAAQSAEAAKPWRVRRDAGAG